MKIHVDFHQPVVKIEVLDTYGKPHGEAQLKITYNSGATRTHWIPVGGTNEVHMDGLDIEVDPKEILKEIAHNV